VVDPVHHQGIPQRFDIGFHPGNRGAHSCIHEIRHRYCREDPDDRDNNQEFNEGKGASLSDE